MPSSLALLIFWCWSVLVVVVATTQKEEGKKDGWTCEESDGFWYEQGKKSEFPCGDKEEKGEGCTNTENPSLSYPRTCILAPPNNEPRCWWTYIPDGIIQNTAEDPKVVPLIIDLHGGGGCASHEAFSSGFRELSNDLIKVVGINESFVTVWPQGYDNQWGVCGSDCDEINTQNNGKQSHSVDDLTFLSNMVATIVKNQEISTSKLIDAERIYVTGFSMGCMMSHRLALERSSFVAGFGCHGGALIQVDNPDLDAQKQNFNLQTPMPAYMTGGSDDEWFDIAKTSFDEWSTWNTDDGCFDNTTSTTTTNIAFTTGSPSAATLTVRPSSCDNNNTMFINGVAVVETTRLEIINGIHAPDARMAAYTWEYLKHHKRVGALDALPNEQAIVVPRTEVTKPTATKPPTTETNTTSLSSSSFHPFSRMTVILFVITMTTTSAFLMVF